MDTFSSTLSQVLQGCGVLAAIVGSDMIEERKRSATESAKRPVDGNQYHRSGCSTYCLLFTLIGFVLEGFDVEHSKECLGDVIRSATNLLPEKKARFIHGLKTPGTWLCRIPALTVCFVLKQLPN